MRKGGKGTTSQLAGGGKTQTRRRLQRASIVPEKRGHWVEGKDAGDSDGLALRVLGGEGAKGGRAGKVGTKDMAKK